MKARRLSFVLGAILFAGALYILGREFGALGPARILAAFRSERRGLVSLAFPAAMIAKIIVVQFLV